MNDPDPLKIFSDVLQNPSRVVDRPFDEDSSLNYIENMTEGNRLFVRSIMGYASIRLSAQGRLFLNDVYDFLGMSNTPEGQLLGWCYSGEGLPTVFEIVQDSPKLMLRFYPAEIIFHKI